jgi:hypothetical protein
MNVALLSVAGVLLLTAILIFYVVVLRPVLLSSHYLRERATGTWQALCGFRTMLISWAIMFAGVLVELYDFFAPMVAGVDISPITDDIPRWAWPLIVIAIGALFRWLRKITVMPEPSTARDSNGLA